MHIQRKVHTWSEQPQEHCPCLSVEIHLVCGTIIKKLDTNDVGPAVQLPRQISTEKTVILFCQELLGILVSLLSLSSLASFLCQFLYEWWHCFRVSPSACSRLHFERYFYFDLCYRAFTIQDKVGKRTLDSLRAPGGIRWESS